VDNTGMPRFVIVWGLVKEDGQWKLDEQISAHRATQPQSGSSPPPTTVIPTASPSASPSASPTPSGAGVPPVREENEPPSQLAKGNQSGTYHSFDSQLQRDHPEEDFTSTADAQETGYWAPE
jgi:hypothetical protein